MNVKIIDGFPQNLKEPLTGVRWTSPVRKSRKNNTMHLSKSAPCRTHSRFFSLWNRPSSLGGDKSSWSVPNLVGFRSFGNISMKDHISLSPSTAWAHHVPAPHAFSPSEQHRATDHNAGDGLIFTPESVDDQRIFLVTNAPDLLKPCLCLRLGNWAICPKSRPHFFSR